MVALALFHLYCLVLNSPCIVESRTLNFCLIWCQKSSYFVLCLPKTQVMYYTCTLVCTTPILAELHLYTCLYYINTCCTTLVHMGVPHQYLILHYTCTPVCTTPILAVLAVLDVLAVPVHLSVLHQYLLYYISTHVFTSPILAVLNPYTCLYYINSCCTTHVHLSVLK